MAMVLREHGDNTWVLRFAGAAGAVHAERLAADLVACSNSLRCSGAEFGAVAMPETFRVETKIPISVLSDVKLPDELPMGTVEEESDDAESQ